VEFESCGIEGHKDKTFRVLRVKEGEVNLVDDLIVIKVDWLKEENFSLSQTLAFMINLDGKTVWVNSTLCLKCMELNGKPVDGKNNMMQCNKKHRWEPEKPLIEVITTVKSRTD
jgi:hypothetical protein